MPKLDPYTLAKLRTELERYYLSGGDTGLSSNFGPLVNIATGGVVGTPDPERHTIRRHGLHGCATPVTHERVIRDALIAVGPLSDVLFAAFGPGSYVKRIDDIFGRGVGERVIKRIGEFVGVVLMTSTVRDGYAASRDRLATEVVEAASVVVLGGSKEGCWRPAPDCPEPSRWDSRLGWLVALCARGDTESAGDRTAERSRIKREAEKMLGEAMGSYARARGGQGEEVPR